jgi:hypothetical protein
MRRSVVTHHRWRNKKKLSFNDESNLARDILERGSSNQRRLQPPNVQAEGSVRKSAGRDRKRINGCFAGGDHRIPRDLIDGIELDRASSDELALILAKAVARRGLTIVWRGQQGKVSGAVSGCRHPMVSPELNGRLERRRDPCSRCH